MCWGVASAREPPDVDVVLDGRGQKAASSSAGSKVNLIDVTAVEVHTLSAAAAVGTRFQ